MHEKAFWGLLSAALTPVFILQSIQAKAERPSRNVAWWLDG